MNCAWIVVQFFAVLCFCNLPASVTAQIPSVATKDPLNHQVSGEGAIVKPLVMAHYMPWFQSKPFSEQWGWHWTMNHFDPDQVINERSPIASKFYPIIGPYDSGDREVLQYHLLLMKFAGIDGVIVDWYGLTNFRDYALLHRNTTRMLEECERLKMKFIICYEDQTISALINDGKLDKKDAVGHAVHEINWLSRYWFRSPSYVRFDQRPVLLSFGHDGLSPQDWTRCIERISEPVLYYSQDYRRQGAEGAFNWPSPSEGMAQYDRFLKQSTQWDSLIPVAYPRFDDVYKIAGVRDSFPVIPDRSGNTLKQTLQKCLNPKTRLIQIATWNDWGEGTQIEPSVEYGYRDLKNIQDFIRSRIKPALEFDPDDLHLPRKILELHGNPQRLTERFSDELREAIEGGDFGTVRKVLAQLQLSEEE